MSSLLAPATFVGTSLKVAPGPLTDVSQGKGFTATGALVVLAGGVIAQFVNGLPLTALIEIAIVDKAAAVAPLVQASGLQYDANGRVVTVDVGSASAPTSASCGLTFDSSGALVTSA